MAAERQGEIESASSTSNSGPRLSSAAALEFARRAKLINLEVSLGTLLESLPAIESEINSGRNVSPAWGVLFGSGYFLVYDGSED